eukprot:scaffold1795_cov187-Alexandrium_tamarense.AAC.12
METASLRTSNTHRSNGSLKYRKIANGSSVDESLFGPNRCSQTQRRGPKAKHKEETIATTTSDKTFISLNDLQRIKRSSYVTNADNTIDKVVHSTTKPKPIETEAAKARKEHMKRMELNDNEEQREIVTQCESEKLDRIRKQAQEKIDKGEDIVKILITCSERAKTFAIRDQQLKDKAEREKKERDYEQRMILAMEIDRLREIEAREAYEAEKVKKMIDGRKIIEQQIEERHQAKLLQEEARDQENREMLDRIRMYQLQDEERAMIRRENAARAREEVMRANEEHIASMREHRMAEKREDEMMVAYQMEQDEKLRQREAEEEKAERRKRDIQKKLLDEQERTLDRRAEIDEIRARRAVEDAERKYRQKQLIEAQKRKRDMDLLDMTRKQQQQEKYEKQQMVVVQMREEYENAIRHSHAMAERERAEAEREQQKNTKLITNLQEQIEEHRELRMTHDKEKYREGAMIKQQLAEEKAKLEAMREKMVQDMKIKGIDERYFGEMTSLDINKYLMK